MLVQAELSAWDEITVRFAGRRPVEEVHAADFVVITDGGREIAVREIQAKFVREGQAKTFMLCTTTALDFTRQQFRVVATGAGEAVVRVGRLLADATKFYDADAVMGAVCTPEGTTFRLFAPTARSVRLVIAERPEVGGPAVTHEMHPGDKGLWHLHLEGDWRGKFYSYRVSAPGGGTTGEVSDPAAVCACGDPPRTLLVHLPETNPPGFNAAWQPQLESYVDAVIYEMNVRDFTIAANSGVRYRGLYLGLTESGAHLPEEPAVRTGLDHLVELGVTHVQLMPVQDFENEETFNGPYNWGYMPVHFNSPEGWYATAPIGDARIRELKRVVQAFHDRGIAVSMDVVYNHTSSRAPFERIVPGYYYRQTVDGRLSNGSGCGNEFASERPMAKKLLLDSLCYWVTEYGMDGFRFDLMGLHAPQTMRDIYAVLKRIKPGIMVYGEPWTGGPAALRRTTDKGQVRGRGIAAFNDGFRDAIKGDRDGGAPGFIQTGERVDGVKDGVTGSIGNWTRDPADAVQYCEAHDNLTTWDKLVQSVPDVPTDIKKRMQCFAGFLVLTAQGTPFIHSGQEFCRSKKGCNNSYNAPDAINRIDWSLKKTNADVFAYYRNLIALRKAHPVFRLRTGDQVRRRLAFLDELHRFKGFAYRLDGADLPGESWSRAIVLVNGDANDQVFALPEGEWPVYADHERVSLTPFGKATRSVTLRAHSGMVLGKSTVRGE